MAIQSPLMVHAPRILRAYSLEILNQACTPYHYPYDTDRRQYHSSGVSIRGGVWERRREAFCHIRSEADELQRSNLVLRLHLTPNEQPTSFGGNETIRCDFARAAECVSTYR